MFVISQNKNRGAVLEFYFIDVNGKAIWINDELFARYENVEDLEKAKQQFLDDIAHKTERIELK